MWGGQGDLCRGDRVTSAGGQVLLSPSPTRPRGPMLLASPAGARAPKATMGRVKAEVPNTV